MFFNNNNTFYEVDCHMPHTVWGVSYFQETESLTNSIMDFNIEHLDQKLHYDAKQWFNNVILQTLHFQFKVLPKCY